MNGFSRIMRLLKDPTFMNAIQRIVRLLKDPTFMNAIQRIVRLLKDPTFMNAQEACKDSNPGNMPALSLLTVCLTILPEP